MKRYNILVDLKHTAFNNNLLQFGRLESILGIRGISLKKHYKGEITREELKNYDAIISLDNCYTDEEVESVCDFVTEDGGGLIINYSGIPFYPEEDVDPYWSKRSPTRARVLGRPFGISDLVSNYSCDCFYLYATKSNGKRDIGFQRAGLETIIKEHPITLKIENNFPNISTILSEVKFIVPLELNEEVAEPLISIKSNLFGNFIDSAYLKSEELNRDSDGLYVQRGDGKIYHILAVNRKHRVVGYSTFHKNRDHFNTLYTDQTLKTEVWKNFLVDLFSWACGAGEGGNTPKSKRIPSALRYP